MTPDDDPPPHAEVSLEALRLSGYEPEAPPHSGHALGGMPEPSESPLWALIVDRLTPTQVEILTACFESTSRGRAAEILNKSDANVRVQMDQIRERIADIVTLGSTGVIYGPAATSRGRRGLEGSTCRST